MKILRSWGVSKSPRHLSAKEEIFYCIKQSVHRTNDADETEYMKFFFHTLDTAILVMLQSVSSTVSSTLGEITFWTVKQLGRIIIFGNLEMSDREECQTSAEQDELVAKRGHYLGNIEVVCWM